MHQPTVYILAGPNGAGKSTLARPLLCDVLNTLEFVNADLIAAGLSPFSPNTHEFEAAEIMLRQVEKLTQARTSFAIETTLSGRSYRQMIIRWKEMEYRVVLYFLSLPSPEFAIERVSLRVRQGGHSVPETTIRRRFHRGLRNFFDFYSKLVDSAILLDSSCSPPRAVYCRTEGHETIFDPVRFQYLRTMREMQT